MRLSSTFIGFLVSAGWSALGTSAAPVYFQSPPPPSAGSSQVSQPSVDQLTQVISQISPKLAENPQLLQDAIKSVAAKTGDAAGTLDSVIKTVNTVAQNPEVQKLVGDFLDTAATNPAGVKSKIDELLTKVNATPSPSSAAFQPLPTTSTKRKCKKRRTASAALLPTTQVANNLLPTTVRPVTTATTTTSVRPQNFASILPVVSTPARSIANIVVPTTPCTTTTARALVSPTTEIVFFQTSTTTTSVVVPTSSVRSSTTTSTPCTTSTTSVVVPTSTVRPTTTTPIFSTVLPTTTTSANLVSSTPCTTTTSVVVPTSTVRTTTSTPCTTTTSSSAVLPTSSVTTTTSANLVSSTPCTTTTSVVVPTSTARPTTTSTSTPCTTTTSSTAVLPTSSVTTTTSANLISSTPCTTTTSVVVPTSTARPTTTSTPCTTTSSTAVLPTSSVTTTTTINLVSSTPCTTTTTTTVAPTPTQAYGYGPYLAIYFVCHKHPELATEGIIRFLQQKGAQIPRYLIYQLITSFFPECCSTEPQISLDAAAGEEEGAGDTEAEDGTHALSKFEVLDPTEGTISLMRLAPPVVAYLINEGAKLYGIATFGIKNVAVSMEGKAGKGDGGEARGDGCANWRGTWIMERCRRDNPERTFFALDDAEHFQYACQVLREAHYQYLQQYLQQQQQQQHQQENAQTAAHATSQLLTRVHHHIQSMRKLISEYKFVPGLLVDEAIVIASNRVVDGDGAAQQHLVRYFLEHTFPMELFQYDVDLALFVWRQCGLESQDLNDILVYRVSVGHLAFGAILAHFNRPCLSMLFGAFAEVTSPNLCCVIIHIQALRALHTRSTSAIHHFLSLGPFTITDHVLHRLMFDSHKSTTTAMSASHSYSSFSTTPFGAFSSVNPHQLSQSLSAIATSAPWSSTEGSGTAADLAQPQVPASMSTSSSSSNLAALSTSVLERLEDIVPISRLQEQAERVLKACFSHSSASAAFAALQKQSRKAVEDEMETKTNDGKDVVEDEHDAELEQELWLEMEGMGTGVHGDYHTLSIASQLIRVFELTDEVVERCFMGTRSPDSQHSHDDVLKSPAAQDTSSCQSQMQTRFAQKRGYIPWRLWQWSLRHFGPLHACTRACLHDILLRRPPFYDLIMRCLRNNGHDQHVLEHVPADQAVEELPGEEVNQEHQHQPSADVLQPCSYSACRSLFKKFDAGLKGLTFDLADEADEEDDGEYRQPDDWSPCSSNFSVHSSLSSTLPYLSSSPPEAKSSPPSSSSSISTSSSSSSTRQMDISSSSSSLSPPTTFISAPPSTQKKQSVNKPQISTKSGDSKTPKAPKSIRMTARQVHLQSAQTEWDTVSSVSTLLRAGVVPDPTWVREISNAILDAPAARPRIGSKSPQNEPSASPPISVPHPARSRPKRSSSVSSRSSVSSTDTTSSFKSTSSSVLSMFTSGGTKQMKERRGSRSQRHKGKGKGKETFTTNLDDADIVAEDGSATSGGAVVWPRFVYLMSWVEKKITDTERQRVQQHQQQCWEHDDDSASLRTWITTLKECILDDPRWRQCMGLSPIATTTHQTDECQSASNKSSSSLLRQIFVNKKGKLPADMGVGGTYSSSSISTESLGGSHLIPSHADARNDATTSTHPNESNSSHQSQLSTAQEDDQQQNKKWWWWWNSPSSTDVVADYNNIESLNIATNVDENCGLMRFYRGVEVLVDQGVKILGASQTELHPSSSTSGAKEEHNSFTSNTSDSRRSVFGLCGHEIQLFGYRFGYGSDGGSSGLIGAWKEEDEENQSKGGFVGWEDELVGKNMNRIMHGGGRAVPGMPSGSRRPSKEDRGRRKGKTKSVAGSMKFWGGTFGSEEEDEDEVAFVLQGGSS
ncbi:hypothetical protein HK102_004479 [Quaeritorhiza haematococci]|nr:hypothetical protein HK102_004479 [Quaeritorhiza haematococci]